MRYIKVIWVCFAISLGAPTVGFADNGTSDPDYDYEPPRQTGFMSQASRAFRAAFQRPSHPRSYQTARRWLYQYVKDEQTFYCGCETNLEEKNFARENCGYVPRNESVRSERLEAEHIMPAYWIAHFHEGSTCWAEDPVCGEERDCCQAKDPRFKRAHNDLVNLIPAIGELNNARSNYVFELINGEERLFGVCDFEIDRLDRQAEPRDDIRGDIARVYYYMRDSYELTYPEELAVRIDEWNDADPIDDKERMRNERILSTQGSANPYVTGQ